MKVALPRTITIQFALWAATRLSLYASDSELYTTCRQILNHVKSKKWEEVKSSKYTCCAVYSINVEK